MLTGAYSQKFKELEQDRLARSSSSDSLNHSQQVAARDKVRQLSLETNRRRRAAELKRRLEAQKEAKRRQEVLEERRRRQQEATQKYQRGQRGSPKTGPRITSGKAYSDSRLQDGVNIARGFSQNATYAGNHSNHAPALDEALRMVGVNTAPASSIFHRGGGYAGGTDYTTDYREGYSDTGGTLNNENYFSEVPLRRPIVDTNGNTLNENKGHYYHGYATTATSTYNGNANRDAPSAQFHQTLHEKQKQLMEQQQAALSEFNRAVLNETLPSQGEEQELQRSSSLSSVDSLEEEQQKKHLSYDGRRQQPGPPAHKSVHASKSKADESAIQTAYGSTHSRPNEFRSGESAISDNRFFTSQATSEQQHIATTGSQRGVSNGEMQVEDTGESDFVREQVKLKPTLLQGSSEVHSQPPSYGPFSTTISQAWTAQAPTETPQSNHYYASPSSIKYSTGPVSVQAGNRPFSARTTATAVSTYPARVPERPDHQYGGHQKHEQTPPNRTVSMSKYSSGHHEDSNYTRSKYGSVSSTPQTVDFQVDGPTQTSHRLQENNPATEKLNSTLENPEKIVKSILKRGQGYSLTPQKVKLGDMKVRDSLEISRATQMTKADRKSVRWTDLKYAEVDEVRSDDLKKEQKVSFDSAKAERSNSAGTRQNDTGRDQLKIERQSASAGPPPRGPTKLHRRPQNASKPPPGRSNSGKKVESENSQMTSRVSGKIINHQQESTNKYAPGAPEDSRLYQNGIRLDKTPTDDEINWLWDKVRTCLNTQEQSASGPGSDTSRQPASVSKQCIDGNRLTANLRLSAQGHVTTPPDHPSTNHKKYNTYPRFRTNSESGTTSLRKTALLHQRRQHHAVGNLRPGYQGRSSQHYAGPVPGLQPSPPTNANHHQPGPPVSSQGPMRTVSGMPQSQNQEVSDSLLAFQQAERLATQENLSESDIAAAMDQQKNQAFMQKVPTALSMEEQRILESLDKLNAQLRTVTSDTDAAIQPYTMQPKPPPQGAGFRSQRPISARQRAVADPSLAHRTRTLSADRSNARINYYH